MRKRKKQRKIELNKKRKRKEKLKKLREKYHKAKTKKEQEEIIKKALKIAPWLSEKEFLLKK